MSPDTAAKRPESGPAHHRAETQRRTQPQVPAPPGRPDTDHLRHHRDTPRRQSRMWTYITVAAVMIFVGALTFVATKLMTGPDAVEDTPERTVEAFLTALLDDRDPAAAAEWLCSDKADRDLTGVIEALSAADSEQTIAWSEVNETGRDVGQANVTAELDSGGHRATWTFGLVAEQGEPQWLVCDIDPA